MEVNPLALGSHYHLEVIDIVNMRSLNNGYGSSLTIGLVSTASLRCILEL